MTAARRTRRGRWPRLDLLAVVLAPLGLAVLVAAQWLDGSSLGALFQGPSALVVFGGTLGAVLISYSPAAIVRAGREAGRAFLVADDDTDTLAATLVALSIRAHRRGVPALEQELEHITDPLLRDGLVLVIDGASAELLDEVVTLDRTTHEADEDLAPRIFEAAAGYAPTMGILGAVLGLMRVMEHLSAPGRLGSGIALAFVARKLLLKGLENSRIFQKNSVHSKRECMRLIFY